MEDERQSATSRMGPGPERTQRTALAMFVASSLVAYGVAMLPTYPGLPSEARSALFILVLAASLWVTEAMPAFAVGLLVIGLQVLILGRVDSEGGHVFVDWEKYLATWGSPLIWLFFGGFVLAQAAEKTGLTVWVSQTILSRLGSRAGTLLAGCMAITFVFSMFISNTAATLMMIAVVMPIVTSLAPGDRFRIALPLGIACAANIGGMATIIGSPPNAIAVGVLRRVVEIDFSSWMLAATPPAVLLVLLAWIYLMLRYRPLSPQLDLSSMATQTSSSPLSQWQIGIVMLVFSVTVLLWLTQALHQIPVTVVSLLPICAFTALGILSSNDVCTLRWDVLLLIAGGLSLGLAVTDTGLASWMVEQMPLGSLEPLGLALLLAYLTAFLSNFMSNTAAANIFAPIALVAATGVEAQVVIPLALGASAAMALPISTPPNAIVFSTEEVRTTDFIQIGLLMGVLAPFLAVLWCSWVIGLAF